MPDDAMELGARLSDAVIMFHEALARSRGLSAADNKALGLIERDGPMTAGELAARIHLSPGAITGLVDRLVAGGHVTREPDATDRRRTLIRASRRMPAEMRRALRALGHSQATFADRYTAREAAAIADWVGRITEDLREQTRRLETSRRPPEPPAASGPARGARR